MKLLTLWQPWATAIAYGWKHYETRSWSTHWRGSLAIHAAKRSPHATEVEDILRTLPPDDVEIVHLLKDYQNLPLGAIVLVCTVEDCLLMTDELIAQQSQREQALGFWSPRRYAWKLGQVRAVEPIAALGGQGLRNLAPDLQQILQSKLPLEKLCSDRRSI